MPITVTPAGSISLCRTNLENDYKNTLTWSNITAQANYFNGLSNKVSFSEYTYFKKDGKLRLAVPIDDVIDYNYCYYNNGGFSTKRYYCFITRMEYVNENCTDLYIETDVFQTWYFQIQWNRCFVEREHVNDDTRGLHTIPENVETGEYVTNSKIRGKPFKSYGIIVGSTIKLEDSGFPNVNGNVQGSIYQGLRYYEFTNTNVLNLLLADVASAGKSSGIVTMFMADDNFYNTEAIPDKAFFKVTDKFGAFTLQWPYQDGQTTVGNPPNPTSVNGYVPRNNKLLTFPYCYLMASNNAGSSAIYRYELFSSSPDFQYVGTLAPGMSIKLQPKNYKGEAVNNNEGLVLGKLPMCSWNTDMYTNWLTQNSVNIATSIAGDLGSIAIGGAMLSSGMVIGGAGTVVSGVTGITGTVGTIYQHSLIPPQINGDVNVGDAMYASNNARIDMCCMSIKQEYARVIDSYFDMFGYKVNRVKVPNITGRSQWNFIKTIDCNVDGNIPQEDLETIKKACDTGITFWHNPANMYNYSLSNTIV